MAADGKNWSEIRDTFRIWREENERRNDEIVMYWDQCLAKNIMKLGDERWMVYEQVAIAGIDCNRMDIAELCLNVLKQEFSGSLRVRKLEAMKYEALERYDVALDLLDNIIKHDETNAAAHKRKIAILKARGRTTEAIKELTDYLKMFMSDQEAWLELSELYLSEQDYAKAAFCLEELLMHNPHNHLFHQRYAEIRYTQGGTENLELAKSYFSQACKLNPNNIRALFGVFLAASHLTAVPKNMPRKKEYMKLATWAAKEINERYSENSDCESNESSIEGLLGMLQITGTN